MAQKYEPESNRIGRRHLRVGLEIDGRSVRVASMWLVDQPVVQLPLQARDLLVHVAVVGHDAFVETFDDPRVARGIYRKREGHAYVTQPSGVYYVSVPFARVEELGAFTVQTVDLSDYRPPEFSVTAVRALFLDPPDEMRPRYRITADDVRRHRDWPKVAGELGLKVPAGRFELYVDVKQRYRWRLLRSDGEIMADSGEGYATRAACEADLQWVRRHAADVPVVFLPPDRPTGTKGDEPPRQSS